MHFETFTLTEAAGKRGEDRAVVLPCGHNSVLIVVADGAGGSGGGAQAAESLVSAVAKAVQDGIGETNRDWVEFLWRFDRHLSACGGETTAVIVDVSPGRIAGASVGNSVRLRSGSLQDDVAVVLCRPLAE